MTAGAIPKETKSAKESSSIQNLDALLETRAILPSKASKKPAKTISQAACVASPSKLCRMDKNPQSIFPMLKTPGKIPLKFLI